MVKKKTKIKRLLRLTKKCLVKPYAYLKQRRKRIILTTGLTFIILVVSYMLSNWDYAITGESTVLKVVASIQQYFNRNRENSYSDLDKFVFINVAYDNMLVDETEETSSVEETGALLGNACITDRKKIYTFLKAVENADYQYIIIDIGLPTKYKTAYDDSLFNQINMMERIVVASEDSLKYIDPRIKDKSFSVNYSTTLFNSDLVKTPLTQNDTSTLAFKVYQDIQKTKNSRYSGFHRFCFLYFDDYSLSKRTMYPKLYLANRNQKDHTEINIKQGADVFIPLYENLGSYVLKEEFNENSSEHEIQQTLNNVYKNKIIILGTFDSNEDVHSTYLSEMNGSLIIANTILSLLNGNHHISIWSLLILFSFFYFITYHILFGKYLNTTIIDTLTSNHHLTGTLKLLPIIIVWTYYSFFVSIVCAILFLCFSEVYDILFTSTFLTTLNIIVIIYRKSKSFKNLLQ